MIYRIVQEGITNAVRHARANMLIITIKASGGHIHIEMRNDGIISYQFVEGFGLSSMRERVTSSGGRMSSGVTDDSMFLLSIDLLKL
jgi:signal transduction histidine kinase